MAISREVNVEEKSVNSKETAKFKKIVQANFCMFPLANEIIAVSVTKAQDCATYPQLAEFYYSHSTNSSWTSVSSGGYSDYQPRVLPNGFYFTRVGYHPVCKWDMTRTRFSEIHSLKHDFIKIPIKEKLDPSLSIIIHETEDKIQLACASEHKQDLYFYNSNYDEGCLGFRVGYSGFQRIPTVRPKDDNQTGEIIYSVEQKDQRITSLASFPELKEHPIAIALNTGEILMGSVQNNKFVLQQKLENRASITNVELFSTRQGLLIGHFVDEKGSNLRIWDLKNDCKFEDHVCPRLFNLCASTEGDHLTGLHWQGGKETNAVSLCQLSPFVERTIKSAHPISNFVIGHKNQVGFSKGAEVFHPGTIEEYLQQLQKTVDSSPKMFKKAKPEVEKPKTEKQRNCLVM